MRVEAGPVHGREAQQPAVERYVLCADHARELPRELRGHRSKRPGGLGVPALGEVGEAPGRAELRVKERVESAAVLPLGRHDGVLGAGDGVADAAPLSCSGGDSSCVRGQSWVSTMSLRRRNNGESLTEIDAKLDEHEANLRVLPAAATELPAVVSRCKK